MGERLDKEAWIKAGLRELVRQGPEAVRVEPLAQILGVTKGSFYWHFKDRKALLRALVEAWQSRATNAIVDEVEAEGGNAAVKLATLFTVVSRTDGRLDKAVRGWAAQDPDVRAAVEAIDRRRLAYLESLFKETGFSPADAAARARLIYHALVGQYMMGQKAGSPGHLSERLTIVLPMLLRRE
jgi:AcrR family transcriptional regulator